MTTAQQIALALIIIFGASIALALLWGKFVNVGRGETRYAPDNLYARLDTLIAERKTAEQQWIADLEQRIAGHQRELDDMAIFPGTLEVIKRRTLIRVQIDGDRHVLELLRQRGITMATLTEGRM